MDDYLALIVKENIKKSNKNVAIVLGGSQINALHIIRALGKSIPIIAINDHNDAGHYSKYLDQRLVIGENNYYNYSLFLDLLTKIGSQLQKKAVLFPTADFHIDLFTKYYHELEKYYYMLLNPETSTRVLSKDSQYKMCNAAGIPHPRYFSVKSKKELEAFKDIIERCREIGYPLIARSLNRQLLLNNMGDIKKVQVISNERDLVDFVNKLETIIDASGGFIFSELIPGEPASIWGYNAFFGNNGVCLGGWSYRKPSQRPYYFGNTSVIKYQKNEIVKKHSINLMQAFKYIGAVETEFKFDARDGKYKLIEINPRYGMTNGVGRLAGYNLPLIQYYYSIGKMSEVEHLTGAQNDKQVYLVFFYNEFLNLIKAKPKKIFIKNILKAFFVPNMKWAIFEVKDVNPSLFFAKQKLGQVLMKLKKKYINKASE